MWHSHLGIYVWLLSRTKLYITVKNNLPMYAQVLLLDYVAADQLTRRAKSAVAAA